ncbi:hypothetical protein pb186bvf_008319 [Paramecium bursaria]
MKSTILVQGSYNLLIGTQLNHKIKAVITQKQLDLPPGSKILYVDDHNIQKTFFDSTRFMSEQLKETNVLIQLTNQNNALMLAIYVAYLISENFSLELAAEVLKENGVNKEQYIKYYEDLINFHQSQTELFRPQILPQYSDIEFKESSQILESLIQDYNFVSSYIRPVKEYSRIFVGEEYDIQSELVELNQSVTDYDIIDTEGERASIKHIQTSRR